MANGFLSGRQRLCRLCVTDQFKLYPIFSDDITDLAEKIFDCTSVVINNVDGVPALICQQCRSRIIIGHHFVVSCQTADRKYHRMFGAQYRQPNRLRDTGLNATQYVIRAGNNRKQLTLPSKVLINPANHAVVQRLKNDDKLRRRHSIDEVRKISTKSEIKRRLSEESVRSSSINLMAAKIEQSLSNDLVQKTETDREKCPKCGLLVLNLYKHSQLHSTITKYACETCNKTFTKSCALKYHKNVHTGEKPYKCCGCGQAFSCPSRVWNHRQINIDCARSYRRSKNHRYHCNVCKCVFKHRKLIDQHMRTNHPDRKYPCEMCGKAYFTGKQLNRHRRRVHG